MPVRIAVMAALGLELKSIRKRLDKAAPCPALKGAFEGTLADANVVLVRVGVGMDAGQAATKVLDTLTPDAALSVGTCGGLASHVNLSDVVAASEVLFEAETGLRADPALLDGATRAGAAQGPCLSVARPLALPEHKADAHAATGAMVCDMEAFHVGCAAAAREIPFLAVKAVSDGQEDRLPDLGACFDERGRADGKKVALYLARRPDEALRAARFARNAARASARLAETLERMLANLRLET